MSERGADQIRQDIAAERQALGDDLDALNAEVRSLLPLAVAGLAVIVLVTFRKGAGAGIRTLLRLV
jgi:hypothetical protein